MTTRRWKPSGARSSARRWKAVSSGPRSGSDGNYLNSSKRLITGAGSTALWGINHLWTSNKAKTKNERSRLKYCDHKKGGRENPLRIDAPMTPTYVWLVLRFAILTLLSCIRCSAAEDLDFYHR